MGQFPADDGEGHRQGRREGRLPRVRPYPLRELPRLLHVQVELSRVLWQHLSPILDAASASTAEGWAQLEEALGGRLRLVAHEPYLFPAEGAAARLHGGVAIELELVSPSVRRAVLALDEGLHDRLAPRLAPRGLIALLRGALRPAPVRVVDFCLRDEVAGILAPEAGRPGRPGPGAGGSSVGEMILALDFMLETPVGPGWARLLTRADLRLGVPARGAEPFSASASRLWQRRDRLADVPLTLLIEAGVGFFRGAEIAGLSAEDIVLLDRFGPRPVVGGPVFLRLLPTGGGFSAHLDGEGVTLASDFHLRGSMMAEQDGHPADDGRDEGRDDGPTSGGGGGSDRLLRELPVQVTCEIGRVTMTGREVLELRPGAVLPVGRPLAGPVDLTVAGRVIARGELVDVEGEIGVRVTEVVELSS